MLVFVPSKRGPFCKGEASARKTTKGIRLFYNLILFMKENEQNWQIKINNFFCGNTKAVKNNVHMYGR
jgi:hypothetical protein